MPSHHEPLAAMGPIAWDDVPQDALNDFLATAVADSQTIVESIPRPPTSSSTSTSTLAASSGRARAKTESAVSSSDNIQRGLPLRQSAAAISQAQDLRKEWKETKINPRDNPLGISVWKLGAKDGRGAWFARRSVHEGLPFDSWKQGLEIEFPETMKVQGAPGTGNIRGIGADKRVEDRELEASARMQVFQLSAQFPGPTSPRDFVTLLLTAETSVDPGDGSRPLRQFMIISKPCEHPQCPPRQGIIRGYYESVEVIREVPIEVPATRRSYSSADLLTDESRKRTGNADANGDAGAESENNATAIEWIMVTRSDPGGSVPRFLIEKGTPPGIVGDAGKFLKWVTAQAAVGFAKPSETDIPVDEAESRLLREDEEGSEVKPAGVESRAPVIASQRKYEHQSPSHNLQTEDEDLIPSSNGLYGIIAGAIGAAGSLVASGLFGSFSESGSAATSQESDTMHEEEQHEDETSDHSETSSIRSFTSALEKKATEENPMSPESAAETLSDTSRSNPPPTQQDKELRKLEERRRKLDEKAAKLQERRNSKLQGDKEKDAATAAKMREKHEREIAKQEEKYKRELRKLEERRELEQRKADERRRKAIEREEKNNMALELERTRAERDVARKQLTILETQVRELQSQNTMLVRKFGHLGLMDSSDSAASSLKSLKQAENSRPATPPAPPPAPAAATIS